MGISGTSTAGTADPSCELNVRYIKMFWANVFPSSLLQINFFWKIQKPRASIFQNWGLFFYFAHKIVSNFVLHFFLFYSVSYKWDQDKLCDWRSVLQSANRTRCVHSELLQPTTTVFVVLVWAKLKDMFVINNPSKIGPPTVYLQTHVCPPGDIVHQCLSAWSKYSLFLQFLRLQQTFAVKQISFKCCHLYPWSVSSYQVENKLVKFKVPTKWRHLSFITQLGLMLIQ